MDKHDLSEQCYRNGYNAGRAEYIKLQNEYDKIVLENKALRLANKELFLELERRKKGDKA